MNLLFKRWTPLLRLSVCCCWEIIAKSILGLNLFLWIQRKNFSPKIYHSIMSHLSKKTKKISLSGAEFSFLRADLSNVSSFFKHWCIDHHFAWHIFFECKILLHSDSNVHRCKISSSDLHRSQHNWYEHYHSQPCQSNWQWPTCKYTNYHQD